MRRFEKEETVYRIDVGMRWSKENHYVEFFWEVDETPGVYLGRVYGGCAVGYDEVPPDDAENRAVLAKESDLFATVQDAKQECEDRNRKVESFRERLCMRV